MLKFVLRAPKTCPVHFSKRFGTNKFTTGNFEGKTDSEEEYLKHDSVAEKAKELIFDLYKNPQTNKISVDSFLRILDETGLKQDDPRIEKIVINLKNQSLASGCDVELEKDEFVQCIDNKVGIIKKALKNQLIVPNWKHFCQNVELLYEKSKEETSGKVASYIPQLARVNPEHWAVSVCTVDGQRASWGDHQLPFCLQSVSKPFSYALAIEQLGAEEVHKFVGQEPSGRFFNEICLDANSKPHNPMVNAGAIVVTSLINSKEPLSDRFDYSLKMMRKFAGDQFVNFKNAVFLSERETADRNYALAYYLREHGCFPPGTNLTETLDLYFQLCSISVTTDSLAVMAATLANGGVSPLINERVVCNQAIGLPAKTGVSGDMMIVVPNCMGIALYSPPLDNFGNSVRSIKFAEEMIKTFNFHHYDSLVYKTDKIDPRRELEKEASCHQTALFEAVKSDDITAIKKYMLIGVNIEDVNCDDRTVLHIAACEGNKETLGFLLSRWKGAPNPTDRFGKTPLQNAKSFGHDECVRLLEKTEANFKNRRPKQ
uniref:Glutaminase n=1 Tax=Panagrolaimus sp. JU765 TaxID=591449 RepID=A0AC34QUB2_9BILA